MSNAADDISEHGTNWTALAALTDEEILARALSDPDCPPVPDDACWIRLRPEDGDTWPERLHNALARERAAGRIPPKREAAPGASAAGDRAESAAGA